MLPDPEFKQAVGVLEMIARNPEQRLAYNARLKFQRDQAAQLEEALEKGERIGIEKGKLIGKIHAFEDMLGIPLSDGDALANLEHMELTSRIDDLQRRLRERMS